MRLHIDYETRGVVDLISAGVYAYAEHPHTSAMVLGWGIDDEPFTSWNILRGHPMPARLRSALLNPDVKIVAHNAPFEWVISMVVGPRQGYFDAAVLQAIRPLERWSCTAARSAACGLPRALEKVARALNCEHQKDMEGHHLMLEMCKPYMFDANMQPVWLDDPGRMERLGVYCCNDGYAERDVDTALPDLSDFEQEVWIVTEEMNSRGVMVDRDLLIKLGEAVNKAVGRLNKKLQHLTSSCPECNNLVLTAYKRNEGGHGLICTECNWMDIFSDKPPGAPAVEKVSQPKRIVAWLKNYGIDTEDDKIGKWIIAGLLEDPEIPEIVREVLVLRRDGGKSSTAKFVTLMKRLNLDSRIRGALLYAGAAATARWSSKGAQLQNLPRGKIVKDVMKAIMAILSETPLDDIETQFGAPMIVFSELVRPLFIATPGYWMARGDYSQIEARVNPWLAGEDTKLLGFRNFDRGTGPDNYIVTAAAMFNVPQASIDKDDPRRQSGKVTDLACGFGGGKGALFAMAKIYGLKLTEEDAISYVGKWREAHPRIKQFWYDLENTAVKCMKADPGPVFWVGKTRLVGFKRNAQNLVMILPSGHRIIYWHAKLEETMAPWGEMKWTVTYWGEDTQKHIWRKFHAWYGIFCENAVQAVARDVMAYALVQMRRRGMRPILTVHDEGVSELSKATYPNARDAAQAALDVMLITPPWARGLPIAAEASADDRYTKGSKENTVAGYARELEFA